MVGSLVVAVKGTAAEILHHLLLTKRRGKSPIRLWKVKLVALRSFAADRPVILETRRHPALLHSRSHGVVFCAQRFASARSLSFALVG